MANLSIIEKEARKLCTHTIVFTDPVSKRAGALALRGISTKAIAEELGITMHEAQYRVDKAQKSQGYRYRAAYRNGSTPLAKKMLRATEDIALHEIERNVAPQFIPFARSGVPRR